MHTKYELLVHTAFHAHFLFPSSPLPMATRPTHLRTHLRTPARAISRWSISATSANCRSRPRPSSRPPFHRFCYPSSSSRSRQQWRFRRGTRWPSRRSGSFRLRPLHSRWCPATASGSQAASSSGAPTRSSASLCTTCSWNECSSPTYPTLTTRRVPPSILLFLLKAFDRLAVYVEV